MKVSATGISNFQPEEPLEKAWYSVSVVVASITQTRTGRNQLVLDLIVEDGPIQSDGSDSAGRQVRDYILLSTDGMADMGVKLTLQRLHNTLESFGIELTHDEFDSDEFLNQTARALIKPKPDADGVLRANIAQYKPI